jgi:PIN domain nuclease of toxin-antitoxin system
MKYILDTHAFLFAAFDPLKLGSQARKVLVEEEHDIYISAVSFWEISLKYSIGRLDLHNARPEDLPSVAREMGFSILSINDEIAASFHLLPLSAHKDPFDRMLAWQAIRLSMILITKDTSLAVYIHAGLKSIW